MCSATGPKIPKVPHTVAAANLSSNGAFQPALKNPVVANVAIRIGILILLASAIVPPRTPPMAVALAISTRLPSSIVLKNSVAAVPIVNDLVNLTAGIN